MSPVTIVVVGIWNGLLLMLLGFVLKHRRRILWVTDLDRVDRDGWDRGDDDKWTAFLTDHPELIDR